MPLLEATIAFLGGAAILLGAVAWLIKSLVQSHLERIAKGHEIALQAKAGSERDTETRHADAARVQSERIRSEILRWANPILGAVTDLKSRLKNVLKDTAYPALQTNPPKPIPPNWSITYEYFMPSTLYLFCQYFYWVRRLQEELSFELFETQADKDKFLVELRKVGGALSEWPVKLPLSPPPPPCAGKDVQVFALQQRLLGEALTVRAEGGRCLGYDEFLEAWEDIPLSDHLAPLRALIDELIPADSCRWQRLERVFAALDSLEKHCESILKQPSPAAVLPAVR